MYFKRSDIQNVKNHITKHANELNVMVGAKDDESYNKALNTILKTKQYYEGEQIDPKHMTVLKKNINNIIINTSNYLVKNADELKGRVNLSNPVDYLTTAIDGFFITAMERLGCPNMPLPHFDPEIKNTLISSAIELNRSFAVYDFSKDDTFNRQRGKDAKVVLEEFKQLIEVGNTGGKKAETVGKMVAEYQALRARQRNHNIFWRMFHRAENKERNDLADKMKVYIAKQLPRGMERVNLDTVVPTGLASDLADARIRGEVEVAGMKRFDPTTAPAVFGALPSDDVIPNQRMILDELSQKEALSNDPTFVNDIIGNDNVKSDPVIEAHPEKNNIIGIN